MPGVFHFPKQVTVEQCWEKKALPLSSLWCLSYFCVIKSGQEEMDTCPGDTGTVCYAAFQLSLQACVC